MSDGTTTMATRTASEINAEVDEATRELWEDRYEWTAEYAGGTMPCSDCPRGGVEICGCCGNTGFLSGEEPLHTYGQSAGNCGERIVDAVDALCDVVCHGRVALERHAAGKPGLDFVPPEAVPLLAELAELGPIVARASALCAAIAELAWAHEEGKDPRIEARARLLSEPAPTIDERASGATLTGTPKPILHVERFEGLDAVYAAVKAQPNVARIEFTEAAYTAYYEAREALTTEADTAFTTQLQAITGGPVEVRVRHGWSDKKGGAK